MTPSPLRSLLRLATLAGLVQVAAGILMYVAGVYFAPWSMGVSIAVLLACILVGVARHRTAGLGGTMSFGQAAGAGTTIAFGTGLLYAVYNVISIRFVYPDFLGQVAAVTGRTPTLAAIAIGNLIRLTVGGTVLALITAPFQRRAG
jgi:hypothetical protein